RWLPLSVGNCLAKRRSPLRPALLPYWPQPLAGWPLAIASCELAAPTGATLQATVPTDDCRPYGLATIDRPLCRGPWPQPIAPLQGALAIADRPLAGGQAVASRPCKGPARGQPPLQMA
ncbi:hypothetical protein B296_00008219, partial [Ensete ventricosum]